MIDTCINHPPNNDPVKIYPWQILFAKELGSKSKVCAALMSFYESEHNIRDLVSKGNPYDNLQCHSQKDLEQGILKIGSKNSIIECNKFLEEKGVITLHNNPNARYAFDNTNYFIFHPEVLNEWIHSNALKIKESDTVVFEYSNKGYIYLMEFNNYYKVGKTKDIKKRSKTIKMLLPKKSKLLAYVLVDDYSEVEIAMHSKFDHLRLNGEWFDLGENAETLFIDAINELK